MSELVVTQTQLNHRQVVLSSSKAMPTFICIASNYKKKPSGPYSLLLVLYYEFTETQHSPVSKHIALIGEK